MYIPVLNNAMLSNVNKGINVSLNSTHLSVAVSKRRIIRGKLTSCIAAKQLPTCSKIS